jgi:hypothetical protein
MSKNVLVQFSRDNDLPQQIVIPAENEPIVKIVIQSLLGRKMATIPDRTEIDNCICRKGQR